MTLAELKALIQRGEPIPPEIIKLLEPGKRGRPRKPYDAELTESMTLIKRVETLWAELGNQRKAFAASATKGRSADTIERQYRRAKRLEKIVEEWSAALSKLTGNIKLANDLLGCDKKPV